MEHNRFFLWTARINSVLFLLLLLISIVLVTLTLFESSNWRGRNAVELIDAGADTEEAEDFRLGDLTNVCGRDVQYVTLESYTPSKGFSSGGYSSSIRNLVFFAGQQMQSHWLFDTDKYLISEIHQLKTESGDCKGQDTVAIYYEIRKDDTNGDGKLDDTDNLTIALTSPDGTNYLEIDTNVTSVLDYSVKSEQSILTMLLQNGGNILMKKYSLAAKKYLSEKAITRIGKRS